MLSAMSNKQSGPTNGHFSQIAKYRPQLLQLATRLVSRHMQTRVDPSDMVQETLLAASRNLPNQTEPSIPILVWLYKLLRQRIIDAKRKHLVSTKRSVNHEEFFRSNSSHQFVLDHLPAQYQARPDSEYSAKTRLQNLETALQSLAPETQNLLRQRYFESLTLAEIAARLGISLSAVKMRHLRAIQELQKVLDKNE